MAGPHEHAWGCPLCVTWRVIRGSRPPGRIARESAQRGSLPKCRMQVGHHRRNLAYQALRTSPIPKRLPRPPRPPRYGPTALRHCGATALGRPSSLRARECEPHPLMDTATAFSPPGSFLTLLIFAPVSLQGRLGCLGPSAGACAIATPDMISPKTKGNREYFAESIQAGARDMACIFLCTTGA
jgi:hypothetical protein